MDLSASPLYKKTIDETFFDLVDCLCGRFIGLSPFEVLNMETRDVYDLYVDVIIHDSKQKKTGANGRQAESEQSEWVTSKTATWY